MTGTEKIVVFGGLGLGVALIFFNRGHELLGMGMTTAADGGPILRQVNSPERMPASGGPVVRSYGRAYIDESPWNPNELGGQRVLDDHRGVQRQQSSGLL